MSVWTHVNAIFRIDSLFDAPSDEALLAIFGKSVDYWHMPEVDESPDVKYLPMGSEGSLDISIWHNSNKGSVASTTVSVFGDLRDFDSFDEIEEWFSDCCNKLYIRQAVCEVYVERVGAKTLVWRNNSVLTFEHD